MDPAADRPLVSIITPSYNQAQFLEETILSVLEQSYNPLEYLIIDGGSTDGSVDVIRRYEPYLAYWVSEPDHGQSEAINKGLRQSKGAIVAWLNSDDCYLPGAVERAVQVLLENPRAGMVHGHHNFVGEKGEIIKDTREDGLRAEFNLDRLLNERDFINQPTVFMRRSALDRVGLLDCDLQYAMDYDLWIRIGKEFEVAFVHEIQANYRLHSHAKTTLMPFGLAKERYEISLAHGGDGTGSGLAILTIRWRDQAEESALRGPHEMMADYRGKEFSELPFELKERAKEALLIGLLDGAYICLNANQPWMAIKWFAQAFSFSPRQVLTRGNAASLYISIRRLVLETSRGASLTRRG